MFLDRISTQMSPPVFIHDVTTLRPRPSHRCLLSQFPTMEEAVHATVSDFHNVPVNTEPQVAAKSREKYDFTKNRCSCNLQNTDFRPILPGRSSRGPATPKELSPTNREVGLRELETEEVVLNEPGVLLRELRHLGIVLPSDPEWRNDNYFRLVQLHRHISEETVLPSKYKHVHLSEEILPAAKQCEVHRDGHENAIACCNSWTHEDLVFTSRLLSASEMCREDTRFNGEDLEQTRRVLTLAFNILRFKPLLMEALDDNEFFQTHPKV